MWKKWVLFLGWIFVACIPFRVDAPVKTATPPLDTVARSHQPILAAVAPEPAKTVSPTVTPLAPASPLTQTTNFISTDFTVEAAKHFPLVNNALQFDAAEMDLMAKNGFMITDRLRWHRFKEAYAWIYWQDLPVLVTTDSILHAVHESYADLLKDLERYFAEPLLREMLTETLASVETAQTQNQNDDLTRAYDDVVIYLQVALTLLDGELSETEVVQDYVQLAYQASSVSSIDLLVETSREVDFTFFKPRAHYASQPFFQNYFRAMSWLAHVDFRLTTPDFELDQHALASAMILREHLQQTGQDQTWHQLNELLATLVGDSDNTTLVDLGHYVTDVQLASPSDIFVADEATLLDQLRNHDYGQQRITGQIVYRSVSNTSPEPVSLPVSFMLIGQRFSLDSYVMSSLVYDRLIVDGTAVERPYPATMDVMYALGNDRAKAHLQPALQQYGYEENLDDLRLTIDSLEPETWQAPVYNQWLGMLRTLNQLPNSEFLPKALQTEAWADKMLQTQLASWAQLRHDNILYVKQSVTTMQVLCEYPAGYVEPYPEFYQAVYQFAATTQNRFANLDLLLKTDNDQNHLANQGLLLGTNNEWMLERLFIYFNQVMAVMAQLETLAHKELANEPFTTDEEMFLKSIVRRQIHQGMGCGGSTIEEHWDGWYPTLFYAVDNNPAVIADVHTNPNNDPMSSLYPPGVLHVASGPVVPIVLIVDTGDDTAMYVGPSFTYYEFVEGGFPPVRLTDDDWRARLDAPPYPAPPAWTTPFRRSATDETEMLNLPSPTDFMHMPDMDIPMLEPADDVVDE
ncbi:MAG: DUF3160 domain-containing protein [Chloroflexota bacterium]